MGRHRQAATGKHDRGYLSPSYAELPARRDLCRCDQRSVRLTSIAVLALMLTRKLICRTVPFPTAALSKRDPFAGALQRAQRAKASREPNANDKINIEEGGLAVSVLLC